MNAGPTPDIKPRRRVMLDPALLVPGALLAHCVTGDCYRVLTLLDDEADNTMVLMQYENLNRSGAYLLRSLGHVTGMHESGQARFRIVGETTQEIAIDHLVRTWKQPVHRLTDGPRLSLMPIEERLGLMGVHIQIEPTPAAPELKVEVTIENWRDSGDRLVEQIMAMRQEELACQPTSSVVNYLAGRHFDDDGTVQAGVPAPAPVHPVAKAAPPFMVWVNPDDTYGWGERPSPGVCYSPRIATSQETALIAKLEAIPAVPGHLFKRDGAEKRLIKLLREHDISLCGKG